jgi:hypothetical protein
VFFFFLTKSNSRTVSITDSDSPSIKKRSKDRRNLRSRTFTFIPPANMSPSAKYLINYLRKGGSQLWQETQTTFKCGDRSDNSKNSTRE